MDQTILTEVDSLCDQAAVMSYQDLSQAAELARKALVRAREAGYAKGLMNARIALCAVDVYQGNLDQARDELNRIEQELVAEASSDENLMRYSHLRGLYFLSDSNYRDSFDALTLSGVLAARLGNPLFQGLCDNSKGCIKLDQEEFQDAYDYFENAGRLLAPLGSDLLRGLVSLNRGCALHGLGKVEEAQTLLEAGLEEAARRGWTVLECALLDELGKLMQRRGSRDKAREYIERGLRKNALYGEYDLQRSLVYEKARLLAEEGRLDEAEQFLADSFTGQQKNIHSLLFYQLLGEIQERQGNYREALDTYKKQSQIHKRIQGTDVTRSILRQEKKILQEANYRLRLISTIGQELVANLDIGRILNLIYAQMNVLMPVDLLIVALAEDSHIHVKFAIKNGLRLEPTRVHREEETSLLAWTVRHKKEILMRDSLAEYSGYVTRMVRHKELEGDVVHQSIVCIPLWYIDDVVGVISVQCARKNAYSNRDLDNLRALGAYAGIAIRNGLQTERMNEINEVLKRQSATDSLTGLVNRREMIRQAKNIWRICRRNRFWITVIMIDLDHFKKINDRHGHSAGDEVLRTVGASLNSFFKRALDCACRYGGEELMVITGDMAPFEAAARVELLREELSSLSFTGKGGESFQVQFSCGIFGEVPQESIGARLTLISGLVDGFLYEAKGNGRNCTYLSDEAEKPPERFILHSAHS